MREQATDSYGLKRIKALQIIYHLVIIILFSSSTIAECKQATDDIPTPSTHSREISYVEHGSNATFKSYSFQDPSFTFDHRTPPAWKTEDGQLISASIGPGHRSKGALALSSTSGNATRLTNTFSLPKKLQKPQAIFSVSAQVWSDTPAAVWLTIGNGTGRMARSAAHSGSARWEHLTVVYPWFENMKEITIGVVCEKGNARFDKIAPLVITDPRFDGMDDYQFRFRERLPKTPGDRIRIAIVGNSSIWGSSASRQASLPYALQVKLEALHPGRFEVVNYGIASWYLKYQIVSISNNFNFTGMMTPDSIHMKKVVSKENEEADSAASAQENAITLQELNPDIIILCSLWNDINVDVFDSSHGIKRKALEIGLTEDKTLSTASLYYAALYDYMDSPSPQRKRVAEKIMKYAIDRGRPLYTARTLSYDDIHGYRFMHLKKVAQEKYAFLVEEFTRRALKIADVWLMDMPYIGGSNHKKFISARPAYMSCGVPYKPGDNKPLLAVYARLESTEKIQRESSKKVSQLYGIPFISLSMIHDEQFKNISLTDYIKLGYFGDQIHLGNRGHMYCADQIYMAAADRFLALANTKQ